MKTQTIILGSLVAAGLATSAAAASYTGDSWHLQLNQSQSVMAGGSFGGTINGSGWSGGAGALRFNQVSGDTYAPQGGTAFNASSGFYTYCTDVSAHISWGGQYEYLPMLFEQANTTFPPAGVNPSWDWSDSYKGIYFAAVIYNKTEGDTTWAQGLTTGDQTAGQMYGAAQLAIWEMLYDSTWGLGLGDFKVTSGDTATRTLAQAMLDSVNGDRSQATYDQAWLQPLARTAGTAGNDSYAAGVNTFNEGTFQGLLYKEGGLSVPDGGLTVGLLGLALAGLAGFSRKLRK